MNDTILEMRSITKTFPGVKALDSISLQVRRGEIHALCLEPVVYTLQLLS
jgi:putative multiple sugar transport system ATP-binding protein